MKNISVLILTFFFLSACMSFNEQAGSPDNTRGQLSLFLESQDSGVAEITFDLIMIHVISKDGTVIEVEPADKKITSQRLNNMPLSLGELSLPAGRYEKLGLVIDNALIKKGSVINKLTVEGALYVPVQLSIKRRQNSSVFLYWNAAESGTDDNKFTPLIVEKIKARELSTSLVYVTNEKSDNVSIINRYTGDVVDTVMTGKNPKGIAVSLDEGRAKVYVANAGSNSISIIDPFTNTVENEVPVRLGTEPVDLAVASIGSGRRLLFVANYRSNSVSVLDLSTYQEINKVDVGLGPVAVETDPSEDSLRVNRFLTFDDMNELRSYREKFLNVYVANSNSHTVSVLRINVRTGRCDDVITLNVGWDPRSLHVDYDRGHVYVVNHGSDKLSVIPIMDTVKSGGEGTELSINNVGHGMADVITDPGFDRMYLLKDSPGELLILKSLSRAGDLEQAVLQPVMGRISVGTNPVALKFDTEMRKLFVVNSGSDDVYVIDKTTKNIDHIIPVGKAPHDLAVISEW